ncbi:glyoxylate/hydroxypyruvate reductase HPR3-like [Prosopis cineraria]|uniref:glyoxylate/hydroxypyruvate reductase HPR3-like n=1 Tax=Prosopis cineraria TaxID=364024 RepID=UPI00240FB573|nr:glyoxylate/hydroxypyruvate reductase HPR3-like [Prosopis cineraria]
MATDLPHILVLGPPMIFRDFQSQHSHTFNFLNFFDSSLSLPQFLSSHNIHPSSVRAILCNPMQRLNADVLRSLPSLGLIVTTSIGTDHIDMPECRRLGVRVASAGGAFTDDVADLAVGLFLDVLMRISTANRRVREGLRSDELRNIPPALRVGGKRVGIIGLGKIGMEVAKRLEPMGCKIMYNSRSKKPWVAYPFYGSAVELAANSDALVVCCALTEQTHHIVDRQVMEALGREGVIVNVGRGGLVEENELVRRLVSGEIAGAGLDVFENEPLVPNQLFSLDNVVLSPHAAALTSESFNHISQLAAANLHAFFSNQPLLTPVTLD